ncbi:uncharacterized protein LOC115690567 [Syzygium oleosum]|uniref:uncharacterized protein LOC115690567 n=1 Tax=Syzygium oleosum TaxID=219896 RepID=UPI0011D264B3|nr:uncharacterized protein LOC115690567 [Syzygium oleosum]XP_030472818.1 uncharacterized protein LOC115690567 [Syzygium oleosum]XP_030472819.1 uncharacterized protein LOC115690567 [Syzygium oleosum]XP_030472820.1 uncharacterized protein LOC115690567 [Syzygium oleosum]XP_030472821.1 uncharacterized protein LOC115690567 [Syzygium oleosum]
MSTQMTKTPPLRGYRRRKAVLNLDLNNEPPVENRDQEGTSTQVVSQQVEDSHQGQQPLHHAAIDVEAIDDDVAFCSPRAFAEAKNKSRRNQSRTEVIEVESDEHNTRFAHNNPKRRRFPANQDSVNCGLYINLESSNNHVKENVVNPPPPPPPPKEPTFSCPICMGPLVEETSTKCGHIFCKACIRAAITAQAKCPTCRKRVVMKDLIRVFLPATTS